MTKTKAIARRNADMVESTGHQIPANSELAKAEERLARATIDEAEAWMKQADELYDIRERKLYEQAIPAFSSFYAYLDERMPTGIARRYAAMVLAARRVRLLLGTRVPNVVWTEAALRPLTHKEFTDSDVRRLAKKVGTRVKNGDAFSSSLVKEICDEDRGTVRKRQKKQLDTTPTPAELIGDWWEQAYLWKDSLGSAPRGFWTDAEEEDKGCASRLAKLLTDIASQLRQKRR